MKLSIAMCTYNGERYLREQLDSLLAQSRKPDQIVIHDDASADDTWVLLQQYVAEHSDSGIQFDLHRNERNLGYVRNFEAVIHRCTGEIIFLCDQDDLWYSDKLAWYEKEFLQRPELGLFHSNALLVDAGGKSLGCSLFESLYISEEELANVFCGNALRVLARRNIATGATMAFRRELVNAAMPIPSERIHDEWFAMVASVALRMDCSERPSMDYRQHGSNQIGARKKSDAELYQESLVSEREHMGRMAARLVQLLERAQAGTLPILPERLTYLHGLFWHLRARAAIENDDVTRRLLRIAREIRRGGYRHYSLGSKAVWQDVLGRSHALYLL